MQRRTNPFRQRQSGHTMLETALIALPFFALILGTLDFSLALFVKATLQHAVREGVRYAVTYQTEQGLGHDASIRQTVRSSAMGLMSEAQAAESIQIRYYTNDSLTEKANNWPGNIVEVSIEDYQWAWMTSLWHSGTPLQLTARSSDRMEGLPAGTSPPER
jgi:Flp pilus assembly protein TadG